MFRPLLSKFVVLLFFVMIPTFSWAQSGKPILDTKIEFAKDGTAKVSYDIHGIPVQDADANKIEAALVFYAYTMNKLNTETRKTLINQVQSVVSKVATEEGLIRADILKDNPILKPLAKGSTGKELAIVFSEVPNEGHILDVKPTDVDTSYLAGAVLYLFQDLVQKLPESGLRLMVLAMGGMNKFYRDGADPSDPATISKAPAYALNLAIDIIQKVSGQSEKVSAKPSPTSKSK